MKKEGKVFVGMLLTAMWMCLPASGEGNGFKLVKQDEVISLYERWVPATPEPVREIQAVFSVRSDAASVVRLLKRADLGLKWNTNTNRYQVHAGKDGAWVTYIRYDLPWPMDDQDCCLDFRMQPAAGDRGTTTIRFMDNGGVGCPPAKGVTRITGTRGQWVIEPTAPGVVRISYTISSDRNTTIPRWISDPLVHRNLFQTLRAFKDILEGGMGE